MPRATCGWCHTFLKVNDTYDNRIQTVYCCRQCLEADWLFRRWQSDEELNRKRHYQELTKGDDNE
jgi:hypothetical protein